MMPALLCAIEWLVPLLLGLAAGRALRRAPRRLAVPALLLTLTTPFWLSQTYRWVPLGLWDLFFLGGLFALTVLVVFLTERPLVLVVYLLPGLVLVEGLARLLPAPPDVPPPERLHPTFSPQQLNPAQNALYSDDAPNLIDRSAWEDDPRPRVLHLGDSMVYGTGVPRASVFTSLLDSADPASRHVNLGVPGTGPDVQLLLLRRWLDPVKPVLVVHHLFAENDISDMDRDYGTCGGEGVLDFSAAVPVERCPQPRWHLRFRPYAVYSPPPYVLRVAASFSRAAGLACVAFGRLAASLDELPNGYRPTTEQEWDHFERVMTAERDELRARGVRLIATVLPPRTALEADNPQATTGWGVQNRMLEILRKLDISALDTWGLFQECVRSRNACFLEPGWNVHLNEHGHWLYARWLQSHLFQSAAPEQIPEARADQELTIPPERGASVQRLLAAWWGHPREDLSLGNVSIHKTFVSVEVAVQGRQRELQLRHRGDRDGLRRADRLFADSGTPLIVVVRSEDGTHADAILEGMAAAILATAIETRVSLWSAVPGRDP